jgi:DNA-binding GntR family transcriptional regulator
MSSNQLTRGLRDQLVHNLRNDMLSGHYKEGDPIRQEEVVARYKVSRTPVREALLQLEHEGLVQMIPNCGARVAAATPDSIHELLLPIRRIIEVFALKLFFDDLNEEDFQRWDEILGRMKSACERGDSAAIVQEDLAFHRSIIERAGEPSLLKIWSLLVAQVRAHFVRSIAGYPDVMDLYREHAKIIEVIRQGDVQVAAGYLGANIGDPPEIQST